MHRRSMYARCHRLEARDPDALVFERMGIEGRELTPERMGLRKGFAHSDARSTLAKNVRPAH